MCIAPGARILVLAHGLNDLPSWLPALTALPGGLPYERGFSFA